VRAELRRFRQYGNRAAPFDAFLRTFAQIPVANPRVLDIGAAAGYYGEVLELGGYPVRYTACDYSTAFATLAERLYPGIDFDVVDARSLPYRDDYFDVVVSGGCIMHIAEYHKAVREAVRVARPYVLLHRTPILQHRPTEYIEKDAYGVRMLEVHFNERELVDLFHDCDVELVYFTDVFGTEDFAHRNYLLRKPAGLNHIQV
jgi:SAM-dependent methyltransferase